MQCEGYLDSGVPSTCHRASPGDIAGSCLQLSWMNGKKGDLIFPSVICLIKIKHIFRLLGTSLPLPTGSKANELLQQRDMKLPGLWVESKKLGNVVNLYRVSFSLETSFLLCPMRKARSSSKLVDLPAFRIWIQGIGRSLWGPSMGKGIINIVFVFMHTQ